MKRIKFTVLTAIFCLSLNVCFAQTINNIDVKKLIEIMSVKYIDGYAYDTILTSSDILVSYKAEYDELIVSIKRLDEMLDQFKEEESKTKIYKKNKRQYRYFENDYISVLYYVMKKYNLVFYITTYASTSENHLKLMELFNPDSIIAKSYLK